MSKKIALIHIGGRSQCTSKVYNSIYINIILLASLRRNEEVLDEPALIIDGVFTQAVPKIGCFAVDNEADNAIQSISTSVVEPGH